MIAYINGLVVDKNEKSLIVLAQSIGYKISVTTELISKVQPDQKVQLFIHTAVREDDISLYGFAKKEELTFYEQLISVSGIGPKMAMEILSAPISMTQQAILSGDIAVLTKIKGLGKKTAERLVLELKNKIAALPIGNSEAGSVVDHDAVEALVGLGYEKFQVVKVLADLPVEVKGTEEIIKYFLKSA